MKLPYIHWSLYFLLWVCGVIAVGALIGSIVFPASGALFGSAKTPGALALEGARRVGFVFMIWAPAIALVTTVRRAYLKRRLSSNG